MVRYKNPNSKVVEKDWITIADMTSLTRKKESEREKYLNVDHFLCAAERESRLEGLYAELRRDERMNSNFERAGYVMLLNPASDGNCQFSALADHRCPHPPTRP